MSRRARWARAAGCQLGEQAREQVDWQCAVRIVKEPALVEPSELEARLLAQQPHLRVGLELVRRPQRDACRRASAQRTAHRELREPWQPRTNPDEVGVVAWGKSSLSDGVRMLRSLRLKSS